MGRCNYYYSQNMKTDPTRLLLACATVIITVSPSALAQRQWKDPASKICVAEIRVDTQIQPGGKITPPARHVIAFDAIEQKIEQGLAMPPPAEVPAASAVTKADSTETQNSATTGHETSREVGANPAVRAQLPVNVVVSPERLQDRRE